jgi:hypothetical protein
MPSCRRVRPEGGNRRTSLPCRGLRMLRRSPFPNGRTGSGDRERDTSPVTGSNQSLGQSCRLSFRARSQPGNAEAGAAGSSNSHPNGWELTIRSMPIPSIMPPTRDPVTPAATPSQIISPRVIIPACYRPGERLTRRRPSAYRRRSLWPGTWTDRGDPRPPVARGQSIRHGPTGATTMTKRATRP